MDDFPQEQEDQTAYSQKSERIRLGTVEWLSAVYPDESLLAFAAAVKMDAVVRDRELQRLYSEMDALRFDQGLVDLLMHDNLPESALLTLVSRLIEREKSDTWQVVARSIAMTRLQHKNKAKSIARKGGLGKLAKLARLEAETIRLYSAGEWRSAPAAAEKITPAIVAMSRADDGMNLQSTTTKPLQWIRRHVKALKAASQSSVN